MSVFQVSEWIGQGAQHRVGRIEGGPLIKVPRKVLITWDKSSARTVAEDLRLHQDWEIPIPKTSVISRPSVHDDEGEHQLYPYGILSEEVQGKIFQEIDLQTTAVREQISELLHKSLTIRKQHGKGIDFLGGEAIPQFWHYLRKETQALQLGAYNLFLREDRLTLIDTNMLDPERAPTGIGWYIHCMIDLQHALVARILKDPKLIKTANSSSHYPIINRLSDQLFSISRRLEAKRSIPSSQSS